MSASILKGRAVPILATAALGGGIYYSTSGGRNQPRQRAESGSVPVSETLQDMAGSGGPSARRPEDKLENDPKDPRNPHRSPVADSKRNPAKKRDL